MASIHRRQSERTGAVSWQVKYRTPEGAARSQSFRLKRDAEQFARNVETAKHGGTFIDPKLAQITVGEWSDKWLRSKGNLKASTRERYRDAIATHIEPRWGAVRLAAVRHEDVQEWINQIDRAPATVRKVHRVLSQVLDFAVKSRRLTINPAKGVTLPSLVERPRRYLTHAQVEALATEVGPRWRLLVLFLAYTGLRWGEVAALRVSRLDLLRRRVIVAESVTPVQGVMVWGPPKGGKIREVGLPKFLVKELEKHIASLSPTSLVFTGPKGGVLRTTTFRDAALKQAAEALGLCEPKLDDQGKPVVKLIKDDAGRTVKVPVMVGHFHAHEFRHTAASLAIASGADVKVVQQMLGHKSATMTLDLYGHLFPDRLDVVADALETARDAAIEGARVAALA